MISSYTSSKLKWLTLIATLTVVWIHSNAIAFLPNTSRLTSFTAHFLMIRMTAWAVPCFFMVSGFLFTYSYQNSYRRFLGKKNKIFNVSLFLLGVDWNCNDNPSYVNMQHITRKIIVVQQFCRKRELYFFRMH